MVAMVLTALGYRLKTATARPSESYSSFTLKAEMHNPKNPQDIAVRDTESTNGAVDSMTVKLRANGVSVSAEKLRGTIISRFIRLASRVAAGVYKATYGEAPMTETALRAAVVFTPRDINLFLFLKVTYLGSNCTLSSASGAGRS